MGLWAKLFHMEQFAKCNILRFLMFILVTFQITNEKEPLQPTSAILDVENCVQHETYSVNDNDSELSSPETQNECVKRIRHIVSVLARYNKLRTVKEKIELLKTCYEGSVNWKPQQQSKFDHTFNSSAGKMLIRKPVYLTSDASQATVLEKQKTVSESEQIFSGCHKPTKKRQKKKSYVCLFCFKEFSSNSGLRNHSYSHSVKKLQFLCAHCSASFSSKNICRKHMEMHTNKHTFFCHICLLIFDGSLQMWMHEKEIHMKRKYFRCRYCRKKFFTKFISTRHEIIYHTGFFHVCRICSCKFASSLALMTHIRKHGSKNGAYKKKSSRSKKFVAEKTSVKDEQLRKRIQRGNVNDLQDCSAIFNNSTCTKEGGQLAMENINLSVNLKRYKSERIINSQVENQVCFLVEKNFSNHNQDQIFMSNNLGTFTLQKQLTSAK